MVQRSAYTPAAVKPVTPEAFEAALVNVTVAGPLTWLQTPVPVVGELALSVAVPVLEQMVCDGPATAVVAAALINTVTSSADVHPPLVMVQR